MTLQQITSVPRGTEMQAEVCVVGGGPAGIAFAVALEEATDLDIILVESGGLEIEPTTRELNLGTNIGLPYYDLTESRARVLGGASESWAGWCRPLDPIDFEERPWFPHSGWPISYEEMRPYYDRAARLCQLESQQWIPTAELLLPSMYLPPFIGEDVEIAVWQGSPPTKFGAVYRDQLASSSQIQVILGATATEILSNQAANLATGVRVAGLDGNEISIRAKVVVLAAGALETARLLLASTQATPAGLANEHDLVGRYFMEHPHLVTAKIELYPERAHNRPYLPAIDAGRRGIGARLSMQRPSGAIKVAYTVSEQRQKAEHLLNFSTHLQTVGPVNRDHSDAYRAFKLVVGNLRSPRRLLRQLRTGTLPAGTAGLARRLVKGSPEIMNVIYHEALRRPTHLALYTQTEQAPNPESRLTLDWSRRDALGMPRINLDWRLSSIDKESVIRSQQIVGNRLEIAGLGRLVPEEPFTDDSPDWGPGLRGGHHHLGTARMSHNPRTGVVDGNGRAHTVTNLYLADSAVFPTSGFANPMLTIVAWALRLADHVGHTYRGRSPHGNSSNAASNNHDLPSRTTDDS